MVDSILSSSVKRAKTLVEFSYGDPQLDLTYHRYTDVADDVSAIGASWASTPTMEVIVPKNDAFLGDDEATVEMTIGTDAFLARVSDGLPHAAVTVRVLELIDGKSDRVDPGFPSEPTEILTHFLGMVDRTIRNPEGRNGRVKIACSTIKRKLKGRIGVTCTGHCQATLGGEGCYVPMENHKVANATLVSIGQSGISVVISDPGNVIKGKAAGYFVRGHVDRGGLSILITDWQVATENFVLLEQPPAEWVAQTVAVYAGCDLTHTTCGARFGNQQHFGGYGFHMPSKDVRYEVE